jgi:hypothetical protein
MVEEIEESDDEESDVDEDEEIEVIEGADVPLTDETADSGTEIETGDEA